MNKNNKKKLKKKKSSLRKPRKQQKKQKLKKTLEQVLENILRVPIKTSIPESQERTIERTTTTRASPITLATPEKEKEDYGIEPGRGNYISTHEDFVRNLQTSHHTTKTGFHSSAETQHLIGQKIGEYKIGKQNIDTPIKYTRQEFVPEKLPLTELEKQVQKRKKERDYI